MGMRNAAGTISGTLSPDVLIYHGLLASSPPWGCTSGKLRTSFRTTDRHSRGENTVINENDTNKGKFILQHTSYTAVVITPITTIRQGDAEQCGCVTSETLFEGSHDHQRPQAFPVSLAPGSVI